MSDSSRTPPNPTTTATATGDLPDQRHDDARCRRRIDRYAHAVLHRSLGTERTTYIALDVWIWYAERRAADPQFLRTADRFRAGIRRKLFDELRKAHREMDRQDDAADIDEIVPEGAVHRSPRVLTPSEIFDQGETIWQVQQAIAQLPPQMQQVIRCYEMDGWTADDVGAALGISARKVRAIRGQAITQLRELLAEWADVGEEAA